ncbi:unnamed protein product [Mesocestoides corti]|uniref:Homeobox domain-containing protein n=1 Tax=Mesocestoides corti TaxID=53468 RepID=A0A0R3URL0_MESCO|nr:unnamed protein product [Mesocestoides corti]
MMVDGPRRKNATRETTATLKAWLQDHVTNPYPTKSEKIMLAIITKMTFNQVSTWFANARRRLKKENKMTWSPKTGSSETRPKVPELVPPETDCSEDESSNGLADGDDDSSLERKRPHVDEVDSEEPYPKRPVLLSPSHIDCFDHRASVPSLAPLHPPSSSDWSSEMSSCGDSDLRPPPPPPPPPPPVYNATAYHSQPHLGLPHFGYPVYNQNYNQNHQPIHHEY